MQLGFSQIPSAILIGVGVLQEVLPLKNEIIIKLIFTIKKDESAFKSCNGRGTLKRTFKLLQDFFCSFFTPSLLHMSNQWWAYGILRNHPRVWNAIFLLLIKLYILFGLLKISLQILAICCF